MLTLAMLQAAPFVGTFQADQGVVRLVEEKGVVRGTIMLGSERVSLRGKVVDGVLAGRAIDGLKKEFEFRATLIDGVLSVTILTDTIEFTARPTRLAAL